MQPAATSTIQNLKWMPGRFVIRVNSEPKNRKLLPLKKPDISQPAV